MDVPKHHTLIGRKISMTGASANGTAIGFATRSRIYEPSSASVKNFLRSCCTTIVDSDSSVSNEEFEIACNLSGLSCYCSVNFTYVYHHGLDFSVVISSFGSYALNPQIDDHWLLLFPLIGVDANDARYSNVLEV